jgi:hypothetical protein
MQVWGWLTGKGSKSIYLGSQWKWFMYWVASSIGMTEENYMTLCGEYDASIYYGVNDAGAQGWDKDNNPFVQAKFFLDMNFTDWDLCFQEYQTESALKHTTSSTAASEILESDPSKTTYNKFVKEATKGSFGDAND